jgi:xanthine dehydrogenase accessory factor
MNDLLIKALEASRAGNSYAFATIIESTEKGTPRKTGSKMIVMQDGTIYGSIGGGQCEKDAQLACLNAIRNKQNPTILTFEHFGKKGQPVCGGQTRVYIEQYSGVKHLVICGAGHIGLYLSFIGKMLDFNVTVLDDRKEFANKERFPHVDNILLGSFKKNLSKIDINNNTLIMIVTYGHSHDFECVENVIDSQAGYIGVIASNKKKSILFDRLKKNGALKAQIAKLDIPAGIDIGAQTPQEIAISISAEIIKRANSQHLNSNKFLKKK